MANISQITVDKKTVSLVDTQARSQLEKKQTKLKAGKGISISEDGVISCCKVGELEDSSNVQTISAEEYNNLESPDPDVVYLIQ